MTLFRHILSTVLCLLVVASASAQDVREKVELLLMDNETAIFSSEGYSNNKKEAVENSCIAVLRQLLYNGVEDFNGGFPIVGSARNTNLWLQNFFAGKNPTYKTFVSDVELIGDFVNASTGELYCKTNVVIKYNQLLREAQMQGVMEDSNISAPQAPTQTQPKKKQGTGTFL